jgi:Ca2+/Na+ antiporter
VKTIFEDKKKFYVLSIILFFVTSLLIKILLSNIGEQLTYIVFPIYFLVLTILYLKNNKIDWSVPIILTTFYLFISYILLTKDMSALKVVLAFFSSYIPIYILKLRSKDKKDKIRKEKLKERQLKEENSNKKTLISSFLPLLSMVILEFY